MLVHARKKYACPACEEGVSTATLPAQPIPKSNASPGLLAHIATQKYQDALPLYRQESIMARSGIGIPRSTLANWMITAGELIQPLINLLSEQQLNYPIQHCDETIIQVLNEPGKNETGITQLGCWAHARRKFVDAQKATQIKGKQQKNKSGKADLAISYIARLYAIEKEIKDLEPNERYAIRQQKSVPLLSLIKEWTDNSLHKTLPKGHLGTALNYLNKNWEKLTVYTQDGRLNIDNNPAENAIRPFVIGIKNWLFSATVQGATSSANLYNLIETAKANQLEPYSYLRRVFKALPLAGTVDDIEALLPWNMNVLDGVY